jgi:oligoribonuclease
MAGENPPLIWIDCEMTGLSLHNDALVEIAVLVTDADLNILGDGVDLVIATTEEKLTGMRDEVRAMHTESGLHTVAGKSPLAGNSVGMDRNFIARDMPKLNEYLHYRTIDVSSIKELAKRWYPKVYFSAPKKTGNHRALGDIKDSIEELRYYRTSIFIPNN